MYEMKQDVVIFVGIILRHGSFRSAWAHPYEIRVEW